jgi:hypothetical protein
MPRSVTNSRTNATHEATAHSAQDAESAWSGNHQWASPRPKNGVSPNRPRTWYRRRSRPQADFCNPQAVPAQGG